MILNSSPTELTTAATDLVLAALAVAGMVHLRRALSGGPRVQLWISILMALGISALLGAVVHGLVLERG